MKKALLFLLFFVCQNHFGQELALKIIGNTKAETTVIDSIGYQQKHSNTKKTLDELKNLSNQLIKIGYLENELLDSNKPNDTSYQYTFKLGTQTKWIHVAVAKNSNYLKFEKDTLVIALNKIESFLNSKLTELELKGFSLATLKLVDFTKENNTLVARLQIDLNKKRVLDEIIINGYEKFPMGHKKNIEHLYRKKLFNKTNLNKIYKDFNAFRFVNQTRYPEILFSEDSTKVYVYLEKAKANRFDGYIGFTNNENNKLEFTGYLDLALTNILDAGEQFNLYWKSDANKQTTFNASIELPYIFKSPLGIKANLSIFKQDSIYQNTKTAIDAGYYFANNKKVFIGYQSTESSDIQNTNTALISDFESTFITSTFTYSHYIDHPLFPEKTKLTFKNGVGNRKSKIETNKQAFFELNFSHDLHLNKSNILNVRSENFYLQSSNYIINELYRFGGIRSIRGFNENSLQGTNYVSLLTEYRYLLTTNLYVHSVVDYGSYQDNSTKTKNNLLGLGFGAGILSKNGTLKIIYANGSSDTQAIKLANSVIHIQFNSIF